jgi:prepilin-type N-terminal cleavage/methylation domain-containing protein
MSKNHRKSQAGFTLVELLVTVAIILVLIGIAIPSYSAAVRRGNLSSAAGTVDAYAKAARMYQTEWSVFPLASSNLAGAEAPAGTPATCAAGGEISTVDATTLSGTMTRSGYLINFKSSGTATGNGGCAGATTYDVTANPVTLGSTGNEAVCEDNSGTYHIVGALGTPATGAGCKADGFTVPMGQ